MLCYLRSGLFMYRFDSYARSLLILIVLYFLCPYKMLNYSIKNAHVLNSGKVAYSVLKLGSDCLQ